MRPRTGSISGARRAGLDSAADIASPRTVHAVWADALSLEGEAHLPLLFVPLAANMVHTLVTSVYGVDCEKEKARWTIHRS